PAISWDHYLTKAPGGASPGRCALPLGPKSYALWSRYPGFPRGAWRTFRALVCPTRGVRLDMQRMAQCSCGSVRAEASGEPVVVACHCVECQRRTGYVLGVGAYYPESSVAVTGDTRQYERGTDSGNRFTTHFCPSCGSTVYWFASRMPGSVGIAVGAF